MKKYPVGNAHAYETLESSIDAYTYVFADALRKASVKNSISDEQAKKIALQLILGSAKLVSDSDSHPWELVDMVCSPAGTTIEGVASLLKDAFESKIIESFDSAI